MSADHSEPHVAPPAESGLWAGALVREWVAVELGHMPALRSRHSHLSCGIAIVPPCRRLMPAADNAVEARKAIESLSSVSTEHRSTFPVVPGH